MQEHLAAILDSVGITVPPSQSVDKSFEDWLGCNDDPDYQGTTVEDSAPLQPETYQRIQDWIKQTWDPEDAAVSLGRDNPFMASSLSPRDMSLAKVLDSVRATQWLVYWNELNMNEDLMEEESHDNPQPIGLFAHLLRDGDTTITAALYHYIQSLPAVQSQMHAFTQHLQKSTGAVAPSSNAISAVTTALKDPQTRLQQYALAQAVAQRFQLEWDQHVHDLEKLCEHIYLVSNVAQRKTCRRHLGQVWTQYIYSSASGAGLRQENTRAAGIRLTLQVLHRILLGVSEIRDSHEQLLIQQLIPLHKPDAMVLWRDQVSVLELYHEPLVKCMAVILQKKRALVPQTISELLHVDIFPLVGNTPKQVLLLHEVDTYLGLWSIDMECSAAWLNTFLTMLKRCMTSDHSRVAERALEFFKNKSFKRIIADKYQLALENLLPALVRQQPSWNPTVRKMTYHVLKDLCAQNERLFEQVSNRLFDQMAASDTKHVAEQVTKSRILQEVATEATTISDASLKAGMGAWKPPSHASLSMPPPAARQSGDQPGRGQAPWASQSAQPPSTVTGVAPWAISKGGGSNPPLTVTGVAPWAVTSSQSITEKSLKHQKPSRPISVGGSVDESGLPTTGYAYVKRCMEALKPPEEETGASSWSKAQMAETPTLLPHLKFHDLVFGHDLGRGAFGQVRYARLIDKSKTRSHWPEYAVKIISTETIRELGYEKSVQREIAVLRILSHPGIARLVSSFRFQDGAYLVLEYASHGDLHTLLRKHGSLDAQSTRFVVGSVVAALASIHDMGLVYGDLKAENVLITETGHIKIADFGGCRPVTLDAKAMVRSIAKDLLSKLRDGDWKTKTTNKVPGEATQIHMTDRQDEEGSEDEDRIEGTTSFLPPEVVMGSVPTIHADTWALGCLTFQCLSGRPPFFEADEETTRQTIVTFNVAIDAIDPLFSRKHAQHVDVTARDMIQACLRRNAIERPLMEDLARCDFFSEAGLDVFSLHANPAYPLDVGDVAAAPDAQWSRRQFSSIWAPQPAAYDISLPDDTVVRSNAFRPNTSPPIVEGDEAIGYFSASGQAPGVLGKISERLPSIKNP